MNPAIQQFLAKYDQTPLDFGKDFQFRYKVFHEISPGIQVTHVIRNREVQRLFITRIYDYIEELDKQIIEFLPEDELDSCATFEESLKTYAGKNLIEGSNISWYHVGNNLFRLQIKKDEKCFLCSAEKLTENKWWFRGVGFESDWPVSSLSEIEKSSLFFGCKEYAGEIISDIFYIPWLTPKVFRVYFQTYSGKKYWFDAREKPGSDSNSPEYTIIPLEFKEFYLWLEK